MKHVINAHGMQYLVLFQIANTRFVVLFVMYGVMEGMMSSISMMVAIHIQTSIYSLELNVPNILDLFGLNYIRIPLKTIQ